MKISSMVMNYGLTNMGNSHTLSIGSVDLVVALIHVPDCEIVEFSGDMMGGTQVLVPISIYPISSVDFFVTIAAIIILIAVPTIFSIMAFFTTDLASDIGPWGGAAASTTASSAPS
jgi:hypothetical protein